jgi:uncharacterized membrane protein YjgN (DUF898 family)
VMFMKDIHPWLKVSGLILVSIHTAHMESYNSVHFTYEKSNGLTILVVLVLLIVLVHGI